jgi:prepilin-type N-terminal cleavage/methylation domain-containing protein
MKKAAFTLSEVLISLSVLGLISALTLPSVFNSVNERRKLAVFKETLNALQTAHTDAIMDGSLTPNSYGTFFTRLNHVKFCQAPGDGCRGWGNEWGEGVILQNGAYVWGFVTDGLGSEDGVDGIFLDYNGTEGPNQEGVDYMYLARCKDAKLALDPCGPRISGNGQTGVIGVDVTRANSLALWNSIFK